MQTLPLDFQIAVELAYWEGLTGAEISHVLQVPANTVRSRLSRARSQLKEAIAELAQTPEIARTTLQSIQLRLEAA